MQGSVLRAGASVCGRWGGGREGGFPREGTEAALWPCCPGQAWVSSGASFSVRQHARQWMGRVCGHASSRVRACVCVHLPRACVLCVRVHDRGRAVKRQVQESDWE